RAHCHAEPAHDVPVWGGRCHRGRRALHPAAAKTHNLDLGAHHHRGVAGDAGGTARTGVGDRPCPRALRLFSLHRLVVVPLAIHRYVRSAITGHTIWEKTTHGVPVPPREHDL